MSVSLTAAEVALRLALTALAAGVLGFDREAAGNTAGMRTMLLVGLAACIAMVEVNLLLDTVGKAPDSFVQLDMMRLPLGVLTGIGFIGGGAILKRRDDVIGLTTAASLWFMTILGLCFGAGLLAFGSAAAAVGFGRAARIEARRKADQEAAPFQAYDQMDRERVRRQRRAGGARVPA